nr:thioredoxin-like protein [Colletotrichum truncatum]KAF6782543.1 thioredoxin-like protein [Colletotrichum truncatum]
MVATAPREKTQLPITVIAMPGAFDDLLSSNNYVVVDFHTPRRRVTFAKLNVNEVPEVAGRYRVASLPIFTLIRD